MNKEVLLSNNVFGTKVASSFMNKRYIYGLVLLALSLISSTIFYYQIIFNRIIALFPSVVLAIVLFLLTIKHQSSLENKRSIQEQIKRGIYFGSIIYIGIVTVSYLKIHGNYLNRVIGIINVVTNVSQITINAIVQVLPSIVLSIMFSIISYYLYKKARKRIKEDCKFEFRVSLKEEKKEVREQIAEYKRRRRTVQFGTYYRLADSFQENQSAWNIVSEDGMEVIFTHVQILARSAYRVPVIRLKGLDPDAVYTDCETGQEYGGDELMYAGIRIPRIRQDFSSTTMVLRKS